jgi:hypothetical protein
MTNNGEPTSRLMLDTVKKKAKWRRRSGALLEGELMLQGVL